MRRTIVIVLVVGISSVTRADEKHLIGTWVAVSATNAGKNVADDLLKSASIVFEDGKFTASLGEIVDKGTFKIDRTRKPNSIDLISNYPPKKGKGKKSGPTLGVFELAGDTLTVNFSMDSDKRPTDFTSTAENKNFVVVYKRKK